MVSRLFSCSLTAAAVRVVVVRVYVFRRHLCVFKKKKNARIDFKARVRRNIRSIKKQFEAIERENIICQRHTLSGDQKTFFVPLEVFVISLLFISLSWLYCLTNNLFRLTPISLRVLCHLLYVDDVTTIWNNRFLSPRVYLQRCQACRR